MKRFFLDLLGFLKGHWIHLVLMIPAFFVVTLAHESMHALAVITQGGTLHEFIWLPSGGEWGHVTYSFPFGLEYNEQLVSLAPYIGGSVLCLISMVAAIKSWPYWMASTLFIWCFVVPLADMVNAAVPYLLRSEENDLYSAFGPPQLWYSFFAVSIAVLIVFLGYLLQRRLYRIRALGIPCYLVFVGCAACAVFCLTMLL